VCWVNALSAAAAATATAAAAATTDKFEVTTTAAVAAAIAGTLSDYQATRPWTRPGRRRSAVEEARADRRGRPLADPEPTANPDSKMLWLRPDH
jgi:hypothetical protein